MKSFKQKRRYKKKLKGGNIKIIAPLIMGAGLVALYKKTKSKKKCNKSSETRHRTSRCGDNIRSSEVTQKNVKTRMSKLYKKTLRQTKFKLGIYKKKTQGRKRKRKKRKTKKNKK